MATSNGYSSELSSDTSTTDESDASLDNNNSSSKDPVDKVDKVDKMKHLKLKFVKETNGRSYWDPLDSLDWDQTGPPGYLAAARIRRDISSIFKEPLPGIFAVPDENNMSLVHCLLVGSFDTPYEGGFFHFLVRFGPSYPMHPPRVRLITTERGNVRFNPNLYKSGRVCLSILGTWSGPPWSPASNLGSLLLSIQSIMNEKPYFNEPGFSKERYVGQSDDYNLYLTHETLRVAVCGPLESIFCEGRQERVPLPPDLHPCIRSTFQEFSEQFLETCNKHKELDGQRMKDAFGETKSVYNFASIEERLKKIKKILYLESAPEDELPDSDSNDSPPSSLSSSDNDGEKDNNVQQTTVEKTPKIPKSLSNAIEDKPTEFPDSDDWLLLDDSIEESEDDENK